MFSSLSLPLPAPSGGAFFFFFREAEPPGEVGDSQEGSAGGRFACLWGGGGHREGGGRGAPGRGEGWRVGGTRRKEPG